MWHISRHNYRRYRTSPGGSKIYSPSSASEDGHEEIIPSPTSDNPAASPPDPSESQPAPLPGAITTTTTTVSASSSSSVNDADDIPPIVPRVLEHSFGGWFDNSPSAGGGSAVTRNSQRMWARNPLHGSDSNTSIDGTTIVGATASAPVHRGRSQQSQVRQSRSCTAYVFL